MHRRSLPLLLALGLLAACGQKGPLVRPAARTPAAVDVHRPAAPAPAPAGEPAPAAIPEAAPPAIPTPPPAADDDTFTPPRR
jgi:predicted small lipoprotein YifL